MTGKTTGKICAKHPELHGTRYLPSYSCVGCSAERNYRQLCRNRVKIAAHAGLVAQRDQLLAALETILLNVGDTDVTIHVAQAAIAKAKAPDEPARTLEDLEALYQARGCTLSPETARRILNARETRQKAQGGVQ